MLTALSNALLDRSESGMSQAMPYSDGTCASLPVHGVPARISRDVFVYMYMYRTRSAYNIVGTLPVPKGPAV